MTQLRYSCSRAYLQSLVVDGQLYEQATRITEKVVREAMKGNTKHILTPGSFSVRHVNYSTRMPSEDIARFIEILREHLPDCTIEHRTSTRLDGTTESGIVIDWS